MVKADYNEICLQNPTVTVNSNDCKRHDIYGASNCSNGLVSINWSAGQRSEGHDFRIRILDGNLPEILENRDVSPENLTNNRWDCDF